MLKGVNIGAEQVGSTLHWGPMYPYNGYAQTTWQRNSAPGYNQDFHTYGVEWTPGMNYCSKFIVDIKPYFG